MAIDLTEEVRVKVRRTHPSPYTLDTSARLGFSHLLGLDGVRVPMPLDFDFKYDERTDAIQRLGHYSSASNREATREEALMWDRIQELEKLLEKDWPKPFRSLFDQILTVTTPCVELSAADIGRLLRYAAHYTQTVTDLNLTRKQIICSIRLMVDGHPTVIWIKPSTEVPSGTIREAPGW